MKKFIFESTVKTPINNTTTIIIVFAKDYDEAEEILSDITDFSYDYQISAILPI